MSLRITQTVRRKLPATPKKPTETNAVGHSATPSVGEESHDQSDGKQGQQGDHHGNETAFDHSQRISLKIDPTKSPAARLLPVAPRKVAKQINKKITRRLFNKKPKTDSATVKTELLTHRTMLVGDFGIEAAKKLSIQTAMTILERDVNWVRSYLYCTDKLSTFNKLTHGKSSEEVVSFQKEVSQAVLDVISQIRTFAINSKSPEQRELDDKEVSTIITMVIMLKKMDKKPEDILPKFLRGQCELVHMQSGLFIKFKDSNGNDTSPLAFKKISNGERSGGFDNIYAISSTEREKIDHIDVVKVPQNCLALQGTMAPSDYVKAETESVETHKGGADAFILLPQSEEKATTIASIKDDSVSDPALLKKAVEIEGDYEKQLQENSKAFLEKLKSFETEILKFEKQKEIFNIISLELKDQIKENKTGKITEEQIGRIIHNKQTEFAQLLGVKSLSLEQKIGIFVNYKALIFAKQVGLKASGLPLLSSGISILGDILHIAPAIEYFSLIFTGVSMAIDADLERKKPLHLVEVPDLQKNRWFGLLKGLGAPRVGLEALKFLPPTKYPAIGVSIVAELFVIGAKLQTIKAHKANLAEVKRNLMYNATEHEIRFRLEEKKIERRQIERPRRYPTTFV
jgi:hypothetical protein